MNDSYFFIIGWFQTLFREKVKSQRIGNRTLNSESAWKIMPACEIWVFECMYKCLFFQKTFLFVLMEKLPQALKFCMQALFLRQIQNLKSDFLGFGFLLFLGIKSESNHFRVDKNTSVCKINLRQIAVSAIISTLGSKLNNLVGFKEVLWSTQ